jgi:hypothetical protein
MNAPPATKLQAVWDSLGPPGKRRASGPGQPGERANLKAGERAGNFRIRQIAHWKQGGSQCRDF